MNKFKNDDYKVPVFSWCPNIHDSAVEQIDHLAKLPFVFHHVALMPDNHKGYGMPIGSVIATENVIIPNAVGLDIGCGMCAVKTSLESISPKQLKNIMGEIRKVIPLGKAHHDFVVGSPEWKTNEDKMAELGFDLPRDSINSLSGIVNREYIRAVNQLGTLGGGNHFIEIQKGSDGFIWIMIHSGSRNLGKQVAEHYNNVAINLNKKWHSVVPESWELAFLPMDSEEGQDYLLEMDYCIKFALANRKLMMEKIVDIFIKEFLHLLDFDPMINIAHNYASMENHFKKNVMVHRKGATLARDNTIGIIPGSQGSHSYIVSGKGNKDSFTSCSHGAGRLMGRKQAIKDLNLKDEIKKLDDQGIIHSIRHAKDLEEAPSAYKDIDEVMDNQVDLVDVVTRLDPLAVIKG
jgi:tRNA-splicing ligase RtcB